MMAGFLVALELVLERAAAGEIPAGAQVVVANGATLSSPSGTWSAVPVVGGPGGPAEVIADEGKTLRVRLATEGCVRAIQAARNIDVTFVVRASMTGSWRSGFHNRAGTAG